MRNGVADAHDVHIDDPPRSDIQMSHLGVAHLSGRQSHGQPRGLERGPGVVAKQLIEARLLRLRDRIPFLLLAAAKAVENDEDEEGAGGRGHGARTILKDSEGGVGGGGQAVGGGSDALARIDLWPRGTTPHPFPLPAGEGGGERVEGAWYFR